MQSKIIKLGYINWETVVVNAVLFCVEPVMSLWYVTLQIEMETIINLVFFTKTVSKRDK